MARQPTIVAMGGGGFSMEPANPLLDALLISLADVPNPRVCFVPTASGDAPDYIAKFYAAFAEQPCRPSHLAILQHRPADLEAFVLSQDVIYVGGGNTAAMLATWRVLGLADVLREAWQQGTIMAGLSAGSICWFESGPSDSWAPEGTADLRPMEGLGFLSGSHCPHYDGEPQRRPVSQQMVRDGVLPPGYAADDGAALVFRGNDLQEVVASRHSARGYRVERVADGVREVELATRFLG